jgi:hypothetical protein
MEILNNSSVDEIAMYGTVQVDLAGKIPGSDGP